MKTIEEFIKISLNMNNNNFLFTTNRNMVSYMVSCGFKLVSQTYNLDLRQFYITNVSPQLVYKRIGFIVKSLTFVLLFKIQKS